MSETPLPQLTKTNVHIYLTQLYNQPVEVQRIYQLGENPENTDLKGFGYGFPYVIEFTLNNKPTKVVLETMRPGPNGHDHFSDRAGILIWQHSAFNKLPKHVHSVDVGAFENTGKLVSVGKCNEFFIVAEFIQGKLYHQDLDRIKETNQTTLQDIARCKTLSDYLANIHKTKNPNEPQLYIRRIRDLIGHGECIMGLTDSYPKQFECANQQYLIDVEKDCVTWRWKLKEKTHRLTQVHGDYHPWNLLFREGTDFTALDRSRGEWGEPADDIAALTINYLFYSLQKHGKLAEPWETLFNVFWENYLQKTSDQEVLEVIQPFYAWRGLVVASPVWYPNLTADVRTKLLSFVRNVLLQDRFDFKNVNSYFKLPKTEASDIS
jgi:hypothetical protein